MPLILPVASGNIQAPDSSERPASVHPRPQQPDCFRPDAASASPALWLLPSAGQVLGEAEESQACLLKTAGAPGIT